MRTLQPGCCVMTYNREPSSYLDCEGRDSRTIDLWEEGLLWYERERKRERKRKRIEKLKRGTEM